VWIGEDINLTYQQRKLMIVRDNLCTYRASSSEPSASVLQGYLLTVVKLMLEDHQDREIDKQYKVLPNASRTA